MNGSCAKYWGAAKFGFMLGLKYSARILVFPFVGALRGFLNEVDRANAEISAYNSRVFGDRRAPD